MTLEKEKQQLLEQNKMMQRAQNSGGIGNDLIQLNDKPADQELSEKEERKRRKRMREVYETPSKSAQKDRDFEVEMTDLP